ncbi:YozQ family protein [Halobacillus sp. BBL2006]|uniref:YozQ family protein n=1 Tax=Halobacillus sp. BBL2006 TaxID=1543706 RepID=UPI0005435236|nr:YozQ family protein [Halobacillus sp. BBL2006]KHE72285.1 hypothetical protein LD39_05350 [Halobacillus sp. BBL2006]
MKKEAKDNAEKVAGRTYQYEDNNSTDQGANGLATTHEQATDTLTEGTIDGKIDRVNQDGQLLSHDGEEIKKSIDRKNANGKTK